MGRFCASLDDLGIEVSTGRVVDFRARSLLRALPEADTAPLIYPLNLQNGFVEWPRSNARKPQAMALLPGCADLLLENATYVLVKRFSAKGENRRIVAAVHEDTGRIRQDR